jgi:hypothetical protein
MRDQAQTYKSAGGSAKQLALHLCGKVVFTDCRSHGAGRLALCKGEGAGEG